MLKGILEGCILYLIDQQECYGYEMVQKLNSANIPVAEGSIYPLLLKLQKEQLITATFKPSKEGPQRKYYRLTDSGKTHLKQFKIKWNLLNNSVNKLIKEKKDA